MSPLKNQVLDAVLLQFNIVACFEDILLSYIMKKACISSLKVMLVGGHACDFSQIHIYCEEVIISALSNATKLNGVCKVRYMPLTNRSRV